MKSTTRKILLATLLLVAGGAAIYLSNRPAAAGEAGGQDGGGGFFWSSHQKAGQGGDGPEGGSAVSARVSDRAEREAKAAKEAENKPPAGIGEAQWKQAGQLYDMVTAGIAKAESQPAGPWALQPEVFGKTLRGMGIDPARVKGLDALLAARNEKYAKAGEVGARQLLSDPRGTKEAIALGIMQQTTTLTDAQQQRLEELKAKAEPAEQERNALRVQWEEDEGFLKELRAGLPADQEPQLDAYLAKQKHQRDERNAFSKSREVSDQLNLDADQRQAVFDLYTQNPQAGQEEMLPLLTPAQQQKLKAAAVKTKP
ncbi:MAG: hypothetical protein JWO82_2417 [Akkermansiaceae bacterium]|nr:hypothetical protein [Akkermansiaceae bacterium]